MAVAINTPQYFVDFLREPIVDVETGEVLVANPSFYEAISGNLSDLRSVLQDLLGTRGASPVTRIPSISPRQRMSHMQDKSRTLSS